MSDFGNQNNHLEQVLQNALAQRQRNSTIRKLTTNAEDAVDFSSNDFLSLATSQALRQDFLLELESDPALLTNLGSGGSRLLDGNSTYAEQLEQDIADFHNAPVGLLCNSGFDANVGLFSCLPQTGDVIVYDEFIHASVHDGMRLSRAKKCLPFRHNSVTALRKVLEQCLHDDPLLRAGHQNIFIAIEAIYSMDGDVAPAADIVHLVHTLFPHSNAHLIIDEAHSTGVLGPQGRGLISHLHLESAFTVRLHTFGKALACNGAILLCRTPTLRNYLLNYARPLIYTTFMSYPALAAIRTSYTFLQTGASTQLTTHLSHLTSHLHTRLLHLQTTLRLPAHLSHLFLPPATCPASPIFAVLTSAPKALASHCQRAGFVVRGIVPPTVPVGTERVRVCLHAGNTVAQVDGLVRVIGEWILEERRRREGVSERIGEKKRMGDERRIARL